VAGAGERARPPVHTCRPQVASDRRCSSSAFNWAARSGRADQVRWRAAAACVRSNSPKRRTAWRWAAPPRSRRAPALLLVGPLGDGVSDPAPAQQPPAGGGTAHSRSAKGCGAQQVRAERATYQARAVRQALAHSEGFPVRVSSGCLLGDPQDHLQPRLDRVHYSGRHLVSGVPVAGADPAATVQLAVPATAHEFVDHPGRDAVVLQSGREGMPEVMRAAKLEVVEPAGLTAVWSRRRTPWRDSTVLVPAATWLPPPGPALGGSWLRMARPLGASGISRMPASLLGRGLKPLPYRPA
jgi:hypothetical protein